jgi:hypothetical protein
VDVKSSQRRVRLAVLLYLAVFFGSNVWVWGRYTHGVLVHSMHNEFPLGSKIERFGDLIRFSGKPQVGQDPRMTDGQHLMGTIFPRNYPPFAVVIYKFLLVTCAPYAVPVLLLFEVGAILVACVALWLRVRAFAGYRWYMGPAIYATGLIGWGTEATAIRGNIEGVMWVGVCLGAVLYSQRRYLGAGVAFGVSCCLKPYPVLWLALMARHRRFKETLLGLLAAGAVTLGSLLTIDHNPLRAYYSTTGQGDFMETYIAAFRPMGEMEGDHSIFQTIKTIARVIRNHGFNLPEREFKLVQANDPLARKLLAVYLALAVVAGLLMLWKVWKMPTLNQFFTVACVCTVFPLVAADYTLNVLLIPMGFFLIFLVQDGSSGAVRISLGQMLWFLLPLGWLFGMEPGFLLVGVLRCLAVLVVLGASLTIPLPSTVFGETASPQTPA